MAASTVLQELNDLYFSRPSVDASPGVVAAWYDRKGVVLEHLAAEGSGYAGTLVDRAHQHAAELRSAA